jgi:hypothetical protein
MPNTVHNGQADPMSLTLHGVAAPVALPGNGNVAVNAPIDRIAYHGLTYTRVGDWVVADNVALTATYPGGQNINLRTPQGFEVVYHYQGP